MTYAPPPAFRLMFGWMFPPAPVSFEMARPDDTPALQAVHAASFAHDWSVDELASLIGEPNVLCLVAKRANGFGTRRPVGFLLLRVAVDEAEVLTIAIDPRRRGRGYGRQLMLAGIERLVRRGVASLFLEVDEGNLSAVALYQRLGFVRVGVRQGYYQTASGEKATALVMRLDL